MGVGVRVEVEVEVEVDKGGEKGRPLPYLEVMTKAPFQPSGGGLSM